MYPWPSHGGFLFRKEESPIYNTDIGWGLIPSINQSRALGSSTDIIQTIAIGSATRSWEAYFTADRYKALQLRIGTKALLTDWDRPNPDSRMAVLTALELIETIGGIMPTGILQRKRHVKLTFVSA